MKKANLELVKFIKEARARGFEDYEIRQPLLKEGWSYHDVERAFSSLKEPIKMKNKLTVYVDDSVLRIIEKRAKRNMLSVGEQIEDIVRRSAINTRKTKIPDDKVDDKLVSLFSRKRRK